MIVVPLTVVMTGVSGFHEAIVASGPPASVGVFASLAFVASAVSAEAREADVAKSSVVESVDFDRSPVAP